MKGLKIVGWIVVALLVLLVIGITATIGWRPFIGPAARPLTNRTFAPSPERLARGRYLADNLLNCFACHSEREWTKRDVPVVAGMLGAGTLSFPLKDLPGSVYPPNITPDKETGVGNWTDDQLARAIREGVSADGRALFPMMPYENFRYLSDEDLASVVVYLRSLPPVKHAVPKTELIFPVKYLINSAPQPVTEPVNAPDMSTPARRGDYLVTIGGCRDCHTPQKQGQRMMALDLAGGAPLEGPWGFVASANITQAPSGIPYYDEKLFIDVMRTGWVKARELKPIMPWWNFRGLTDEDLSSIFAYLKTVPQIAHRVDNSKTPTMCKLCGFSHGAGDQN
jgi:mono/diheme cytochrome c family protein